MAEVSRESFIELFPAIAFYEIPPFFDEFLIYRAVPKHRALVQEGRQERSLFLILH